MYFVFQHNLYRCILQLRIDSDNYNLYYAMYEKPLKNNALYVTKTYVKIYFSSNAAARDPDLRLQNQ